MSYMIGRVCTYPQGYKYIVLTFRITRIIDNGTVQINGYSTRRKNIINPLKMGRTEEDNMTCEGLINEESIGAGHYNEYS